MRARLRNAQESNQIQILVNEEYFVESVEAGMPLRFSAFPRALPGAAPLLGEHNREILSELLGYTASEIDSLEGGWVLGSSARA